jgi:hypothetical protein
MTVDVFPDWAAVGRGVSVQELWPKVHPELTTADYMDKLGAASDRYRTELYEVVELVRPK